MSSQSVAKSTTTLNGNPLRKSRSDRALVRYCFSNIAKTLEKLHIQPNIRNITRLGGSLCTAKLYNVVFHVSNVIKLTTALGMDVWGFFYCCAVESLATILPCLGRSQGSLKDVRHQRKTYARTA